MCPILCQKALHLCIRALYFCQRAPPLSKRDLPQGVASRYAPQYFHKRAHISKKKSPKCLPESHVSQQQRPGQWSGVNGVESRFVGIFRALLQRCRALLQRCRALLRGQWSGVTICGSLQPKCPILVGLLCKRALFVGPFCNRALNLRKSSVKESHLCRAVLQKSPKGVFNQRVPLPQIESPEGVFSQRVLYL